MPQNWINWSIFCIGGSFEQCNNLQILIGETSKRVEDSVEDRRAGFVDLLLKADGSSSSAVDATTSSQETLKITDVEETKDSGADAKVESMFFLVVVNFAVNILYWFTVFSNLIFNKKGCPFLFGLLYCYFQTQMAEHVYLLYSSSFSLLSYFHIRGQSLLLLVNIRIMTPWNNG